MTDVTDVPDRTNTRAPATEQEISRLLRRLRTELGLTNALGGLVLVLAAILFDPPGREETDTVGILAAILFVMPGVGLGVWASNRLIRPLVDWLRTGVAGTPAPPEIQRLVIAHPALQALVLFVVWLASAIGIGVFDAVSAPSEPVREFFRTAAGIGVAGAVVATLSFLADQRILGPWYGRFFAGDDPTRHRVPSTRVRRRLLVIFTLGSALPLLVIAGVVTERLRDPASVGQLEAVVWFLAGVGIATGLTLVLSVRQSIVRPLELIRTAAERVRAGDLTISIPVESPDEFGEVAVAFNSMVGGLRERQRLADLFGRQVGDAVARRALEEGVGLGGERRETSILFLDLERFSALAEDLSPEDVVRTLNRVFDVVVREVTRHHGLVNKFMGDAVLAVFGAPLDDPEHARHAIDAARAIARELSTQGIRFGIGVSTGNVVAGNVGTEERFEYTVVGNAVNEASRLQELTRERDACVLVSGRTIDRAGSCDGFASAGRIQLRGRSVTTEVYELT